MCSVYEGWKIGNNSIRIYGKKYSHSCPVNDFKVIIKLIITLCYNNAQIIKYNDIINYITLHNIYDDEYLKKNKFKITVVLNVLLLEGAIIKLRTRGSYQIVDLYKIESIEKEISNLVNL